MNREISTLDPNQMQRLTYSHENEALRVELVGAKDIKMEVDTEALVGAVKDGLSGLTEDNNKIGHLIQKLIDQGGMPQAEVKALATIQPSFEVKTVEIPTIVKELEIKILEVPVIVKEVVIKEINVPVVIEHIKTIEIEKPVIIHKTEFKSIDIVIPDSIKILLLLQTISILGILINLFLRGK